MTALAERLHRLIGLAGPISLAAYMAEANAHYYATRDPLGTTGDFITAPEVSQMFGEMLGIWCADLWTRAGKPEVCFVELGPGRGTLARDALRAARAFGLEPEVHLVETSPVLRATQARLVPGANWHDDLASVPRGRPMLLVANEFLDALPVRQLVKAREGWRERMVGLVNGGLAPVSGGVPMDAAVPPALRDAPPGAILEACPAAGAVLAEVGARLAEDGGGALIIDYGYADGPKTGSTLQAVRGHTRTDPFATPGEADLTALVDFAAACEAACRAGAQASHLAEQGAWLAAMGIAARAEALARAVPAQCEALAAALHRLTHPSEMGTLFKVLALTGGGWPDGTGFATDEPV